MADESESKLSVNNDDDEEEEEDLDQLKQEIARMEAEAARIAKEAEEMNKEKPAATAATAATKAKSDSTSIYVGQVDYSTTPEELLKHFDGCGTVERVTIVCDKFTGRPKGFAYLEFDTEKAVETALKLDGSEFKGRNLKVTSKRVNEPAFMRGGGGGRGRGRGRGGGRRGRGRGGRGRFSGGYHPYY